MRMFATDCVLGRENRIRLRLKTRELPGTEIFWAETGRLKPPITTQCPRTETQGAIEKAHLRGETRRDQKTHAYN